jgi:hypothetical protein
LIEHWDGTSWTITPNPTIAQSNSTLSGVAAISANDAWVVGGSLIEHWDGASWKVVSNPGASSNGFLGAIAATSSKVVWAVGSGNGALIEHWDDASWKIVPGAPTSAANDGLTGVSAAATNDVGTVGSGVRSGSGGCAGISGAVIEHWDGARWSSVPFATPPGATYGPSLATIAAVAPNDAWVVGGFEASRIGAHAFIAPVIEHWDGVRWSNVTSPTISTHRGFADVAAIPGGPAWVVGQAELSNGAGPTVIEQWRGGQWEAVASPSPGTPSNGLNNVAAIACKYVWAVGDSAGGTLTEHWDGTSWSVFPSANGNGSDNVLNGVAGTFSNDVWTVGYAAGSYGQGLIQHWDGSRWSAMPGSSTSIGPLYGVATRTSRDAWAVGREIQHWDGSNWKEIPGASFNGSNADTFFGVAAVAANDVWAVGGNPPQGCGGTEPALSEHWNGAH